MINASPQANTYLYFSDTTTAEMEAQARAHIPHMAISGLFGQQLLDLVQLGEVWVSVTVREPTQGSSSISSLNITVAVFVAMTFTVVAVRCLYRCVRRWCGPLPPRLGQAHQQPRTYTVEQMETAIDRLPIVVYTSPVTPSDPDESPSIAVELVPSLAVIVDELDEGHRRLDHPTDEVETCTVCLDDYVDGVELRMLQCSHRFHRACIDPWLLERYTCPLCKDNILTSRSQDQ